MALANGEVTFEFEGETFRPVFNMLAIKHFEIETGYSLYQFLDDCQRGVVPLTHRLTLFLHASLLKNHPDITPDDCLPMIHDPAIRDRIGPMLGGAVAVGIGVREGNAPAPARASTGTRRSRARSKQG